MTEPTPHKHAALIKQWVDDTSQQVWFWAEITQDWQQDTDVDWIEDWRYALGPKPTQPPRKICVLAGVEFPMPETKAPDMNLTVYVADVYPLDYDEPCTRIEWNGAKAHRLWLELGVVHLTREAAEQHSRALLAANKQAIAGAK